MTSLQTLHSLKTGICCISLRDRSSYTLQPNDRFVLMLGNFDGVHLAHRALIRELLQMRDSLHTNALTEKIKTAVWFFDPPSSDYFDHSALHGRHISTIDEKIALFNQLGVEYAFIADFPSLIDLSEETFVNTVLKDICHGVGFVCGFNYRFGKNGAGTPAKMQSLVGSIPLRVVNAVTDSATGQTVSASAIRSLLLNGEMEAAASLLGRPYSLCGIVLHGAALGRTIRFPTANLSFPEGKLVPRCGVYFTKCRVDGQEYFSITNVGTRPTVDKCNQIVNCETHLLDTSPILYEKTLEVSFIHFHRSEQAFASLQELQKAIQADQAAAKQYFQIFL